MITDEIRQKAALITFATRADRKGRAFALKFDRGGLITAVAVDAVSGKIHMVAYKNEETLRLALALGEAVYWSRSRQEIWHKVATSGYTQKMLEIRTDCDQDALVLRAEQRGAGACQPGNRSCFYRSIILNGTEAELRSANTSA